MPVISMKVVESKAHPNADALRIYTCEAPHHAPVQVIANVETLYRVGDVIAIALGGSILKDGTQIKRTRLRGVESMGIVLATVDNVEGSDLSAVYCQAENHSSAIPGGISVVKWTDIELLHNVRTELEKRKEQWGDGFSYPRVTYRAKVKLDGSNGGIHLLSNGEIVAQSRTRFLTPTDDNFGFAAWVHEQRAYFQALQQQIGSAILFGEWCGPGIQKRVAISGINRRIFVVFALQYGDHNTEHATIDISPDRLRANLPTHPDIYILPWYEEPITLDFGDRDSLSQAVDIINRRVADVESKDPWVAEIFGIDGLGEGLVLYPIDAMPEDKPMERSICTDFMFKAKGEKHRVVLQKQAVQLDPEVVENIDAFVTMFVTPARLEQALSEIGGIFDITKMGEFLRWMGQDIKKESEDELTASGLEWKQVNKAVTTAAQQWFIHQLREKT